MSDRSRSLPDKAHPLKHLARARQNTASFHALQTADDPDYRSVAEAKPSLILSGCAVTEMSHCITGQCPGESDSKA